MSTIYWGSAPVKPSGDDSSGEIIERDGELYYRITNFHAMPAFLMAMVSGFDHWLFISSTGGLTCGRRDPGNALFPYYTDDKIHDAYTTTGPVSVLLVNRNDKTYLWKPFHRDVDVYTVDRNLYKNLTGNKLVFEEVNHDLGLVFTCLWSTGDRFGFVRKVELRNTGNGKTRISVLDGLRNILPAGIDPMTQARLSTLLDAYKKAEAYPVRRAAVYSLSSVLTDKAEPSESLVVNAVWSVGLDDPVLLLSEDQVDAFAAGSVLTEESANNGKRGAYLLGSTFSLAGGEDKTWYVLADVDKGPSGLPALFNLIDQGVSPADIEADIENGTRKLRCLVGATDGHQCSNDSLIAARHFSNTLFNVMRGGMFAEGYKFPRRDFVEFAGEWNLTVVQAVEEMIEPGPADRASLLEIAERAAEPDLERITLEYLPLSFSRRHGDPSRPWNRFSIDIRNADGSDKRYYQGNWRDIFQNWEALAVAFPEYVESFISKFVNASTADGYNPYRITREGFDWEVLDGRDPWSNIGYWGDHQVNYLVRLIEFSCRYHPGKVRDYLRREIFVYADVPYRIKAYESILANPRDSIEYDEVQANSIADRVAKIGSDGRLKVLPDGSIHRVNLLEKLLVTLLAKISNFAPGGGIWMNTQRPEWNDANNALAGYGLSVVTMCYLRRFLTCVAGVVTEDDADAYPLSAELYSFFAAVDAVLKNFTGMLDGHIGLDDRKAMMDQLGLSGQRYRDDVYGGFSGRRRSLDRSGLLAFIELAKRYLDHSIALNRRDDGLFHSYNLIRFAEDGYAVEHLNEMLEGQVAVLSSGCLDTQQGLDVLRALRNSSLYRADKNSYLLYPDRSLPRFEEKNVIPPEQVEASAWIQAELASGRRDFVAMDVNGKVHFNRSFNNADALRAALGEDGGLNADDVENICDIYEMVFNHHSFTGRSGVMYKYEGLGCIYWHMVSKLLLATAEVIESEQQGGAQQQVLTGLLEHFDEIRNGLGIHGSPAEYGAFPMDPYSHTTGFSGVQQPGMTGQVKEDVLSRFMELGVRVEHGRVSFAPLMLRRREFIPEPRTWYFEAEAENREVELPAGSLAFSLCGVPVIYQLARSDGIEVVFKDGQTQQLHGNQLDESHSLSLFRRDQSIAGLRVSLTAETLRP